MSEFTRIEFSTRDGVTLRGDFFQADADEAVIVVMANGFSLVKEVAHEQARQFQKAGISALVYDYRTFGSSDGMPRQETDLNVQATDFHDAVTAAANLPGVDPSKIVMWGIGHGGSVAMMAAGNDPRVKATIFHAPFPSGKIDSAGFSEGLLARAWREREEITQRGIETQGYAKVWRDWMEDGVGDESTVWIHGVAAAYLSGANKTLAEAAGTPWRNEVTLQTFLNIAGTEPKDHIYKITQPALYMVNEKDPFNVQPDVHRAFFEAMGSNGEFKVIDLKTDLGVQLKDGVEYQIEWLKKVL